MTLGEISYVITILAGELRPGFTLTPGRFNELLKFANIKQFKRKIGLPEEYQPGMPLPRETPEVTQKNSGDLRPFQVYMGDQNNPPLVVENGYADLPEDFYYFKSGMFVEATKPNPKEHFLTFLTDVEFNKQISSSIKIPTIWDPIANIQKGYIRIRPTSIKRIHFIYYRVPKDPYFAVKNDRGIAEYDPENSVELEWDFTNQIDITHMILYDLGIPIGKEAIIQTARERLAKGI